MYIYIYMNRCEKVYVCKYTRKKNIYIYTYKKIHIQSPSVPTNDLGYLKINLGTQPHQLKTFDEIKVSNPKNRPEAKGALAPFLDLISARLLGLLRCK